MFSRLQSALSILLLATSLLAGFARAAGDNKFGDNTIERTVNLRTHSLHAPYIDVDLQNRWWDFGADSYVNTNKHVRLTRPQPSQMGWLWSRLALTAANWVVEVEFKISGESSHLYGDGLAMWLTTERIQPGPVYGNRDFFNGLGVFVDTYANSRHSYSFPRISAMLGDSKTHYDFGNDGEGQILAACTANVRRTNVATKLKVTYLKHQFLDVKVQYKAWDDWSDCFRIDNITLPDNPFLGFSAMTGDVADAHDIISVQTSSAILSSPDAPRDKLKPTKKSIWKGGESTQQGTSFFGYLFRLVALGAVCAGGYYGYKEWIRRRGYGGGNFGGLGGGMGMGRGGNSGGFGGLYSNSKRF